MHHQFPFIILFYYTIHISIKHTILAPIFEKTLNPVIFFQQWSHFPTPFREEIPQKRYPFLLSSTPVFPFLLQSTPSQSLPPYYSTETAPMEVINAFHVVKTKDQVSALILLDLSIFNIANQFSFETVSILGFQDTTHFRFSSSLLSTLALVNLILLTCKCWTGPGIFLDSFSVSALIPSSNLMALNHSSMLTARLLAQISLYSRLESTCLVDILT